MIKILESWLEECDKKAVLETPALQWCTLGLCVCFELGRQFLAEGCGSSGKPSVAGPVLHLAGFRASPTESPGSVIRNLAPGQFQTGCFKIEEHLMCLLLNSVLLQSEFQTLGIPKDPLKGQRQDDYFHGNTEMFAFFNALIFVPNSDVKWTVSITARIQACDRAAVPNCHLLW